MYIGPWQELRLGQLLNDHKRLMEQSVHQQLQIIKQQQLIQAITEQQQLQQLPAITLTQHHTTQLHGRPLPLSSLPSVLSTNSPRSHSHQSSYGPSLLRDLSTASTLSNNSSVTAAPSSLVHYHHSNDPYPLPPLPPLSRASPPSSRRRLPGDGEADRRKKKSARATKEQVAVERREQIERMRVMYGLNGSKPDEEQKEQEREVAIEPYVDERTFSSAIFHQQPQRVPISLPRPQRVAGAEVLVVSAEDSQPPQIQLPDAIVDYLMSTAKPAHIGIDVLPELGAANLFTSSRSRATTVDSSIASCDNTCRSETDDESDRPSSPPNETTSSHRSALLSASAVSAAYVESSTAQPSLPPLPLTTLVHPNPSPTPLLPPAAAAVLTRSASIPTPSTTVSSAVSQRLTASPAPPRMSEDEYLRGMAVSKVQQRLSLEAHGVGGQGGAAMGELREQLGSGWAAQYDIVVRPQTALLLTQLATPSTRSTPQRGAFAASMPPSTRSLGLGAAAALLVNGEVNDSRSLLRAATQFTPNGSRPHAVVDTQAVDVVDATAAPLSFTANQPPADTTHTTTTSKPSSRSSTPPTLPAISYPPLTTTTTTAPRSLSLFARNTPSASPSASPLVRPSMEVTLQARRSISLEPLAVVDGRERRGTSVESDDVDEVSTAMLEEETEKLLSFVQTASDSVDVLTQRAYTMDD